MSEPSTSRPFSDLELSNHGMVAEDDMVLVRWSFSGTQKALGKSVKLIGMSLYRLEDGKIAEYLVTLQVIFILEETTPSK